jgi:alpha-1,2-mannosyltransferase
LALPQQIPTSPASTVPRLDIAPPRDIVGMSAMFVIVFLLAACWYFAGSDGIVDPSGRHAIGRDFINLWTAGRLVREGRAATVFDVDGFHGVQEALVGQEFPLHLWSYPPHFLFIVAPLGLFGYLGALALWSLVTVALYAGAAGYPRPLTMAVLAAAPATLVNLTCGQTGALAAAFLFGGLRLMPTRPVAAGVLFGLLTVKPQLGLLVPLVLLVDRRWAVIAWAAFTTILLVALSAAVFGPELWSVYVRQNFAVTRSYLEGGTGPFMDMTPSAFMALRAHGVDLGIAYAVQGVVAVLAAVGLIFAWRSPAPHEYKVALTGIAALLATPYAHNYDMTVISLGVLAGYRLIGADSAVWRRACLALIWLLPIAMVPLHHVGITVAPWLLLGYFGWLLAQTKTAAVCETQAV